VLKLMLLLVAAGSEVQAKPIDARDRSTLKFTFFLFAELSAVSIVAGERENVTSVGMLCCV